MKMNTNVIRCPSGGLIYDTSIYNDIKTIKIINI